MHQCSEDISVPKAGLFFSQKLRVNEMTCETIIVGNIVSFGVPIRNKWVLLCMF